MRKLFFIITLTIACLAANAQDKAGVTTIYPRVGLSLSKFHGDKIYYGQNFDEYVDAKMKTGFTGGVEVQHMFTDILGASIGALYSQQGTKYEPLPQEEYENLSIDLDYINIPILLVGSTNVGISLKAGIQPEIRICDKYSAVMDRVSFAIPVGISYDMGHFSIDLRYNLGMSRTWKEMGYVKNHTIMLTLGYGFEL